MAEDIYEQIRENLDGLKHEEFGTFFVCRTGAYVKTRAGWKDTGPRQSYMSEHTISQYMAFYPDWSLS